MPTLSILSYQKSAFSSRQYNWSCLQRQRPPKLTMFHTSQNIWLSKKELIWSDIITHMLVYSVIMVEHSSKSPQIPAPYSWSSQTLWSQINIYCLQITQSVLFCYSIGKQTKIETLMCWWESCGDLRTSSVKYETKEENKINRKVWP